MTEQINKECDGCEEVFVDNSRWYSVRSLCEKCFQVEYEDAMVARDEAKADGR